MNSVRSKQVLISAAWCIAAILITSIRTIPVLSIMPLAIGVVECLAVICIIGSVITSGPQTSAAIGILTPICLWLQRFADGYMIPVYILSNLSLTVSTFVLMRANHSLIQKILLTAIPAFCVLLLGSAAALLLVKGESALRALTTAWNTVFYSGISILTASVICLFVDSKTARPSP